MRRSASFETINSTETVSNALDDIFIRKSPDIKGAHKRRQKSTFANIFDHYSITIKPKLHRSSSLSELTAKTSDTTLDFIHHTSKVLLKRNSIYGCSGDAPTYRSKKQPDAPFMSWKFRGRKTKKKPEMSPATYASKFASDYMNNFLREEDSTEQNFSSSVDNSSMISTSQISIRGPAFPFKSTPSGNLKVQSNQVVFQSSTVGVLLADPTQAKVKVKIEGAGEPDDDPEQNIIFGAEEIHNLNTQANNTFNNRQISAKFTNLKEVKGKDLRSLGYALSEPIDWLRVQLPKKQDLFQEFYRRIRNYTNTDTIIHIGSEEFHCHRIVLQIYSSYFDMNAHPVIELPVASVTPEAFRTVYEWMIFNGPDSNKALKRDNVLDLFRAAQYLSIKDLEDQCWSFIVNETLFNEDTAFALYREARAKLMSPVMDLMVPRVMRFFLPLVASRDFLNLESEEVMTFLKSNYICVTSEIEVLMAAVRWLHGDWPARQRCAVEVMRCVRFGLVSPWQLVDIKRNPDNSEILEIVNQPEVQQMVDDGLAYVIIKYWYGNNSKNYYHWIDVLDLTEPAERNWIGEETNHVTYKDFLKYLDQFLVQRDQMYEQMAMMQPQRRTDDMPGTMRGIDNNKTEMRPPKLDFPLPANLAGLDGGKGKPFPTMSEFFENRKKAKEGAQCPSMNRYPEMNSAGHVQLVPCDRRKSPERENGPQKQEEQRNIQIEQAKQQLQQLQMRHKQQVHRIHMCTVEQSLHQPGQSCEPPEKDSTEELNSDSTVSADTSSDKKQYQIKQGDNKRYSVAATYLAAATTSLGVGQRRISQASSPPRRPATNLSPRSSHQLSKFQSPQISLFNQSKESLAKINLNKLSTSILGPSNKNYITDSSLFNWDRETVLVFGGIDPHTAYGVGKNTGKDIYRFDPVTNVWDFVGDLPEPRHHHSVAFLRGRVYLVGGADPRDDDVRGKSVVVSTVWSYEPVTRSWFSENGLAVARKNFGLVVHRMALYAIGGQDKKGRVLRSVERFDPKAGSWSEVRPMGVARMAVAAVKYREYIWVAGGMTGEKKRPVCNTVECYNSKTNEWTEIYCLRFPRCFSTLFAMNDRLYIVGGAGKVSEKEKTACSVGAIDMWDGHERQWKLQTEMSIPRHGHALAYLGTQLIVIGGVTTIYMRALSNVESFCCERGAWIRGVTPLLSPLSGHGAVTLPPASLM